MSRGTTTCVSLFFMRFGERFLSVPKMVLLAQGGAPKRRKKGRKAPQGRFWKYTNILVKLWFSPKLKNNHRMMSRMRKCTSKQTQYSHKVNCKQSKHTQEDLCMGARRAPIRWLAAKLATQRHEGISTTTSARSVTKSNPIKSERDKVSQAYRQKESIAAENN